MNKFFETYAKLMSSFGFDEEFNRDQVEKGTGLGHHMSRKILSDLVKSGLTFNRSDRKDRRKVWYKLIPLEKWLIYREQVGKLGLPSSVRGALNEFGSVTSLGIRSIILFGSYAKGEHDSLSDVDVLTLSDCADHEHMVEEKARKARHRWRARLEVHFLPSEEFLRLCREGNAWLLCVFRDGIILHDDGLHVNGMGLCKFPSREILRRELTEIHAMFCEMDRPEDVDFVYNLTRRLMTIGLVSKGKLPKSGRSLINEFKTMYPHVQIAIPKPYLIAKGPVLPFEMYGQVRSLFEQLYEELKTSVG
ncbi:MAG: nucleotidyltransferase domain-containing protein [Candidatus Bathyarchaeia archaeon]|nr:nucleotidyltransferase domain-containing protein [Candidatus Bathyarchaeia archaeon]